ncbi:MAG: ABC transporter permease [Acidimicrobiales bacterium]
MELRLLTRDPAALIYVLAFPVLTATLLGQVFGPGGPEFEGIAPPTYYAYAYVGVVAAAMALVTLPGHLATYRVTGVLLRFRASRFGAGGLGAAVVVVSAATIVVASTALLATTATLFGLPPIRSIFGLVANFAAGTAAIVGLGVLLGQITGSPRSAQGLGLALFFPSFLLGGAGPPMASMGAPLQRVSEFLPLSHMIRGMQEAALELPADGWNHALVSCGFATVFWSIVVATERRAT